MDHSEVCKVLVVGNCATGKTSLIRRYVHGWFSDGHRSTVGVDFSLKEIISTTGKRVSLQLWDIAGQDRFIGLARIYYRFAVAAMVVFDLADPKTFEAAAAWKRDLDSKVKLPNNQPIPVLLIGNKSDLPPRIEDSQAKQFASDQGFIGYAKMSAKSDSGISAGIIPLVDSIVTDLEKTLPSELYKDSRHSEIVGLQNNNNNRKRIRKRTMADSCCN